MALKVRTRVLIALRMGKPAPEHRVVYLSPPFRAPFSSLSGRFAAALLFLSSTFSVATGTTGCKQDGGGTTGTSSALAAASTAPPTVSAPASSDASASGAAADSSAPVGSGIAEVTLLAGKTDCQVQTAELAAYLQRGDIALAGREGGLSASWMVQLPNKLDAQIAFGGYDGQARQIARVRGIGTSREQGPRVFATGSQWAVTWFDNDGLAYTRPPWDMGTPPPFDHIGAIAKDLAADVGLAVTPTGSLVAVAPFGAEKSQLGVFLFAPIEPGAPAFQALGVSRHTKQAKKPAVAADAGGYYIAWVGEGDAIFVTHFDNKGKEADALRALVPTGPKREELSLVPTSGGALAIWVEADTIFSRALDKTAHPSSPITVVAKGARWPEIVPLGDGALVVWVSTAGKQEGQVIAVKLSSMGVPSAQGLAISGEGRSVKDAPAVAVAGGRAGFAWSEVMSATVSTKRALLRTVEIACLP